MIKDLSVKGWQQIETAPKDQPILAWCDHEADPRSCTKPSREVILISGAIGAGKASLSSALAVVRGATVVSFGDEVRRVVKEHGLDPNDRSRLQQIGQHLILNDLCGLVRRTLEQASSTVNLVITGLRHVEALIELRHQLGTRVILLHVDTPVEKREKTLAEREGMERRLVGRYEADITEAQVTRIIPQYAAKVIDGSLPVDMQVLFALQALPILAVQKVEPTP